VRIRWKNGRPIVEIYDPITKLKQHVKARDHGIDPAARGRQRAHVAAVGREARARRTQRPRRATARPVQGDLRQLRNPLPDDYRHRKRGKLCGRSTIEHNRERVKAFGNEYTGRPLRSVGRAEARTCPRHRQSRNS
jgi:hypothetical protein